MRIKKVLSELNAAIDKLALSVDPADYGLIEAAGKRLLGLIPEQNDLASRIRQVCADYQKVTVADMMGKSRLREIVIAKQLTHYFAKRMTSLSLVKIAFLTRNDHSTCLHSIAVIQSLVKYTPEIQRAVQTIESILDCKDKAEIVKRVLRLPVVKANPELVNSSLYIQPKVYSQSKFAAYSQI
jgi:chromosomal replication initiation ATPase DnaA